MKINVCIVFASLLSMNAAGQTAEAPVLGWLLDGAAGEVLTIYGVPGAGRVSRARRLPEDFRVVALSPASELAAGMLRSTGLPGLLDLRTSEVHTLAGAQAFPDAMIWSPSGTALGLLYRDGGLVDIFLRREGGYERTRQAPVHGDSLAISNSGTSLLIQLGEELSLVHTGGSGVLARGRLMGFTFIAETEVPAYVANGQLTIGELTTPLDRAESGLVFVASPAPGRVAVVRSGSGAVTILNTAGQVLAEFECGCGVRSVEAVGGRGIIRLNANRGEPLWLADAGENPRLFFVPSPAERGVLSEQRAKR